MKEKFLHVAVGVIKDNENRVLISKRADDAHQGGLWEFPGGKVEEGETVFKALKRELLEELGLNVHCASPLIKIYHHYPDLSVLLDVFEIDEFSGTARGFEGQQIKWQPANRLDEHDFPAANKAIIKAAQLPRCYAILDDSNHSALLTNLQKILANHITLIQARLKNSSALQIERFLEKAIPLCKQYQAQLLINSALINADKIKADGLHLTSCDLMALSKRPDIEGLIAASCHNLEQLQQAEKMGVDFVVLAPVLPTLTHPDAEPLGWERFSKWVEQVNLPVFALGGLSMNDMQTAQMAGAQGIAAIRAFLKAQE